ncbi:unnamed protein product [Blepharisma stoltei]|uniref:Uncharacterized protein n=1 Tax=Blepharisma stoltei TaxID=1481888 RepID=A0AAU9KFS6_9CILI|nr:unnamed protein product [Blepharisma stoltei]
MKVSYLIILSVVYVFSYPLELIKDFILDAHLKIVGNPIENPECLDVDQLDAIINNFYKLVGEFNENILPESLNGQLNTLITSLSSTLSNRNFEAFLLSIDNSLNDSHELFSELHLTPSPFSSTLYAFISSIKQSDFQSAEQQFLDLLQSAFISQRKIIQQLELTSSQSYYLEQFYRGIIKGLQPPTVNFGNCFYILDYYPQMCYRALLHFDLCIFLRILCEDSKTFFKIWENSTNMMAMNCKFGEMIGTILNMTSKNGISLTIMNYKENMDEINDYAKKFISASGPFDIGYYPASIFRLLTGFTIS